MRRILSVTILVVTCFSYCFSQLNSLKAPDFAFPREVIKKSEANLKVAQNSGDAELLLRSLIDLTLSDMMIDSDSIETCIKRIEIIIDDSKNELSRAMLNLLLADIYSSYYQQERWKFDQRSLPEGYVPANISEWDGNLFEQKIQSLLNSVLEEEKYLAGIKLSQLGSVTTSTSETLKVFPTVFDFAVYKAIALLSGFRQTDKNKIDSIYDSIINLHHEGSAARIYAEVAKIEYSLQRETVVIYGENQINLTEDKLIRLFEKNENHEFSCYILQRLQSLSGNNEWRRWYYNKLETAVSKYPAYPMADCLKNIISEMKRKNVSVQSQSVIVPGDSLAVRLRSSNAKNVILSLYRLNSGFISNNYVRFEDLKNLTLKESKRIELSGDVPFDCDTTIQFLTDAPGYYIIVPSWDGKIPNRKETFQTVYCTNLALGSFKFDTNKAFVVNPKTGEPEKNVSIYYDSSKTSAEDYKEIGKTNSSGLLELGNELRGRLSARIPGDCYTPTIFVSPPMENKDNSKVNINGYTDLGVYHPGDSVGWLAIAYRPGKPRQVAKDIEIRVVLRDASYTCIDTLIGKTDDFGRIWGKFPIPEGHMTGRYNLQFSCNDGTGNCSFMVSDYKLPTFRTEITRINSDISGGRPVIIDGKAETYSGMAISGGEVNVSLTLETGWWRFVSSENIFNAVTQTDGNGRFSCEIPDSIVANRVGRFRINVIVTSPTGETHEISDYFSLKPSYGIIASIKNNIDINNPSGFEVRVVTDTGTDTVMTVKMCLTQDVNGKREQLKTFEFPSGNVPDFSELASGTYDVELCLLSTESDTVRLNKIGFYRLNDKMPPTNSTVLWLPVSKINSGEKLVYGTYSQNNYVLYTLWSDSGLIEQKWLEPHMGIHQLPVSLPAEIESGKITLYSLANYESKICEILVTNGKQDKGIVIETETFRDKITPNQQETWTFRVKNKKGSGVKAGVVLDMYNAALDQIVPNSLSFIPVLSNGKSFSIQTAYMRGNVYAGLYENIKYLNCKEIQIPSFETYGYGFGGRMQLRMLNSMKRAPSARSEMSDEAVTESFEMSSMAMDAGGAEIEEAIENETGGDTNTDDFEYRPSEISLALFKPSLTTDDEGRCSLSFTVPNANTTWKLLALAFTDELNIANLNREIIASKPIMVSPNVPRYLRWGDDIIIPASVYNNTDEDFVAVTTVEFFNPVTGETISKSVQDVLVSKGASTKVTVSFHTPSDLAFVGFRIRSSIDSAADGEQTLIPILPSSTELIESEPFFISAEERSYTKEIKSIKPEEEVVLEYCDNPLWYVVTTLPGLSVPTINIATDIAGSLFSNIVSKELPKRYPIIKEAISYWKQFGSEDSVLISSLSKNEDLKNFLLKSTPWAGVASAETERMEQLSMIFDQKEVDNNFRINFDRLIKLQRSDGGFAWSENSINSSEWVTIQVLNVLSQLKIIGYFPEDTKLSATVIKAMKYLEDINVSAYKKNKAGSSPIEFTRLCTLFQEFKRSLSGDKIYKATIQRIIKNRHDGDIRTKAINAMILQNSGYKSLAKDILRSIEQMSVSTEDKGVWWANETNQIQASTTVLEAFTMIDPANPISNGIVQNLIYQKLSQKWADGYRISSTVAAILNRTRPYSESQKVSVKVDGKSIDINSEKYLGEIKVNLTDDIKAGSIIELDRNGMSPAWGSVFFKFKAESDSIKPASSGGVTIAKAIYLVKDGELSSVKEYKTGDKIRVMLTITNKDNIDFVTISDERASCLEPVVQLPTPIYQDGLCFYRENGDSSTNIFIDHLPKGTYLLSYDMWVNNAGQFTSGVAKIQSQYNPAVSAHSGGNRLIVTE
ncbi:MAG: hypothetical protein J1E38_08620 [Paramuribaculum sp.]|nr:hypothetical protein [Paramuribaculum sp.]